MELIYTDSKKIDQGVMRSYALDIAFGKDENDFECITSRENHVCQQGSMLYIDGTEYGGIVDSIKIDTENDAISYLGRTFHGLLAGKILSPDPGDDYLVFTGEANSILQSIIDLTGLGELFAASTEDSGIIISGYQARYSDAYTVIRKMLAANGAKLHMEYQQNHVSLSAVPYIDFTQDEEWNASQLSFVVEKNFRPVNHLVCLGTGNLKNRAVIHLFTDENGGIQPYAATEMPIRDADYITDTSQQQLFGEDEVTDIYDYANAEITDNYVLLTEKPSDWDSIYGNLYDKDSDGNFKGVEGDFIDTYSLQRKQPSDWTDKFGEYYVKSGNSYKTVDSISEKLYTVQTAKPSDWNGKFDSYYELIDGQYERVSIIVQEDYILQKKKPADWKNNYGNYYVYESDGTTEAYRSVSSQSKEAYVQQTMKPSDWETGYGNYYYYNTVYYYIYQIIRYDPVTGRPVSSTNRGTNTPMEEISTDDMVVKLKKSYIVSSRYENVPSQVAWEPKRFYTKKSQAYAPAWKSGTYYTRKRTEKIPDWKTGMYYTQSIQTVPTWASNTYYTHSIVIRPPAFLADTFYRKYEDRYAELVRGGIEKLVQLHDCNKVAIELNTEQRYDIGDIVGITDDAMGIRVYQAITKKIVTINNGIEAIQYEIGE